MIQKKTISIEKELSTSEFFGDVKTLRFLAAQGFVKASVSDTGV